jgi:hypothetical protein
MREAMTKAAVALLLSIALLPAAAGSRSITRRVASCPWCRA